MSTRAKYRGGFVSVVAALLLRTLTVVLVSGCDSVKWAHVRVRNLSSETLTDVRLVGVDPDVAFGRCPPHADASISLAEPITFTRDVAIEYRLNGELCREPLNQGGDFPARLANRDKMIELHFTTNRVWVWTLKDGRIIK